MERRGTGSIRTAYSVLASQRKGSRVPNPTQGRGGEEGREHESMRDTYCSCIATQRSNRRLRRGYHLLTVASKLQTGFLFATPQVYTLQ